MGKTYRQTKDGELVTDGGRHVTPRYRPGSRTRSRTLAALGMRRADPDLAQLGRTALRRVLLDAQREAAAQESREVGDE